MAQSKEQKLWQACTDGDLEIVNEFANDEAVDVNWVGEDRRDTPLHRACRFGHLEIVKVLLAREKIEVNNENMADASSFYVACQEGHKEVVSLLLADPRIDPNKPLNDQSTPLWFAFQNGHLEIVQHLLASGREMNTKIRPTSNKRTAAEQGRAMATAARDTYETEEDHQRKKASGPLCAALIDEYERDPVAVRHRLRRQPGLREYFIGHLLALVVFHADSFVIVRENSALLHQEILQDHLAASP